MLARSSANQTARVPNTDNSPSINSAISIQEVKEALFSVRNNKASAGLAGNPYNILSHCRSDGYTFYIRKLGNCIDSKREQSSVIMAILKQGKIRTDINSY